MSTPQEQYVAIKAALDTALQAGVSDPRLLAYDFDDVPAPRPENYVSLSLSRRYIDGFRLGGPHGLRGGRLTTGYVSKHVNFARELQRRTRAALEDVALLSGALGPFRFEMEHPITDDEDGYYFGADLWTFANPA